MTGSDPSLRGQTPGVSRRGVLLAAAGAVLARPAGALAGQPKADRAADALTALSRREYAAADAYRAAGTPLFERLAANCEQHAGALRSQLDSVGLRPPAKPDHEELDPAAARVADGGGRTAAIALEEQLVAAHEDAIADVYDPETKRTVATIMAGHAQHLVALHGDPLRALA